jgi:hypothetical protein
MTLPLIIALVWVVVGLWLVVRTGSYGFAADVLLVLLWPLHVIVALLSGDR